MVHRREVDGQAIALGNHGALWGNAMTWWDHDTGSVWSQPLGEAILGPRKGQKLELLASTLTTWADWQESHPDTFALAVASSPRGFALDQMSIVIELGTASASFPVADIREAIVINAEVGGEPVAVVVEPETDNWAVFSREVDGRVVDLTVDRGVGGLEAAALGEVGGGGRWDIASGLRERSPGESLPLLPGFTAFQRDYWTFFPDGQVWDGTTLVADND